MSGKEFRYAAYCWSKITVGHQGFLQVNRITIVFITFTEYCVQCCVQNYKQSKLTCTNEGSEETVEGLEYLSSTSITQA